MTEQRQDILQGTLEMLILRILERESLHGWGIGERLQQLSGEVFQVNQGSLYPALQRLRRKGWIRGEWKLAASGRMARFYALTPAGLRALGEEVEGWRRAAAAVELVLRAEPAP